MFEENSVINDLSIKFLSGSITAEEIYMLEDLLENEENRRIFKTLQQTWLFTSTYKINSEDNETEKSWNDIRKKIHPDSNMPVILSFFKSAAIFILFIGIGAVASLFIVHSGQRKENPGLCLIQVPFGSKSHMILPDSSEVWLNAGTSLRFPEKFSGSQRDVYLVGEAYFKVKSNKSSPFVVHTSYLKVKALGTIFNVKAYPNEKTIATTLVEGVVKLENEGKGTNEFSYTLKPKEDLVYYKTPTKEKAGNSKSPRVTSIIPPQYNRTEPNTIVVHENVNPILTTSWKDSRWVIEGERLDNFAILLERRFGLKINLVNSELGRYKFSGIIENETIEQVLKYLKLTIPIKYVIRKGQVDLMINETLKESYTTYLKQTN